MKKRFTWLIYLLAALPFCSQAQQVPVGLMDRSDDYYRRFSLLGMDSLTNSLMIRPGYRLALEAGADSLAWFTRKVYQKGDFEVHALPFVWQNQLNTHHPYGSNDGAMISAKGYQTLVSAGVAITNKFISFQLRPEFVFAQNAAFTQTFEAANEPALKTALLAYHRRVDVPEKFGEGAYHKLHLGQSHLKFNYGALSLGVSTENLWWGPGINSSLLMSNHAPGFAHISFNTNQPVKTAIGNLEWQIIGGRLEGSGINAPGNAAKPDDWRYLSAMAFVYQPKWVPGLYVGFDRSFISYRKEMGSGLGDYLPLFSSLSKQSFQDGYENTEDNKPRDQRFSLFMKWVMPEAKAEVYVQYGKEDHNYNLRDMMIEPEHSRAYVAGFRKLIPFKGSENEFIQVGLELTQMEAGGKSIRNSGTWYSHGQVNAGYTHQGAFLGAGYGPDNLQNLQIAWVRRLDRLGISFERRVHNNTLYYKVFNAKIEPRRHWVDLAFGAHFDKQFNRFVLNTAMTYISSLNYQYQVKEQEPYLFWTFKPYDVSNLHLRVGLMYRW